MMDLVPLFKALADPSRIRIIALISEQRRSVEEIAAAVNLSPATVSHHLGRLREAGLVDAEREQYYTMYRFRQQPLFDALQSLASPRVATDVDSNLEQYDRQVLDIFLVAGKLKSIPTQHKKRSVILRHIVKVFEEGNEYTELQVNRILVDYHEDVATLRRELIMAGLLERADGIYTRPPARDSTMPPAK